MNCGVRFLKSALWSAYAQSIKAPATPLRDVLMLRSATAFEAVESGSIKSTSANGQSTTMADSSEGVTPSDANDAWVYLVELFDRAKVEIGGAPSDAVVRDKIETYLRPMTGYQNDWTYLRK